ncbi:unnamed protein product [Thlaspi arvense]|uniref:mitogen-activated protein kinase kinase kinase n=1 Tax=Thlaspi arvense TaxID=13288 RepID=A0AAU9SVL8_THLAR|nr:unnamed protein product [Thlaspi arvense]
MDRIIARMKKSSGMRRDKNPVRKLERRDAVKHINYDVASSSSSSAEDVSVSTSSLMTRSLEFPDRTSFRIVGGADGEMDRIYRDLGIHGPEDLAISFDAWEACKMRSASDVVNRYPSFDLGHQKFQHQGLSEAGPSGAAADSSDRDITELARPESIVIGSFCNLGNKVVENNTELARPESIVIGSFCNLGDKVVENKTELTRPEPTVTGSFCNLGDKVVENNTELTRSEPTVTGSFSNVADKVVENKPSLERTPTILVKSRGYLLPPTDVVPAAAAAAAAGGGIKGVRPPVLKPPPSMKRHSVDHHGSSWDFLNHFAPLESETIQRPSSSSSSSSHNEEEAGEEVVEEKEGREVRSLQSADTADEACSFTTNEGGETSSTVSNASPIYSSGYIITSWQKGGLLGRGSFGSVYEGISGDGDFFAVKEVSLLEQGSQAQECIQQLEGEIALLSRLQHPNIVRYRGTAKDESNLYIFLELVSQGSLQKLYKKYPKLMDSAVSSYTRQILDGLKYLHDKEFIHRDIKCANILVDANGAVKLADFGLAKVSKLNDAKSSKGTPFWMAPEVINLKRTTGYGSSADIWSLGCTVLEMLTRQIPYCDLDNPAQALFKIGRGVLPDIPDTLSQDAKDFVIKCLKVDPEQRPTAAELLNHPFVRRPLSSSGSGSGAGWNGVTP